MTTDTQLQKLYNQYYEFTDHMVVENNPLAVAGIMLAQSLSIYKTLLSEQEYNRIIDSIIAKKDQVQTFTGPSVQ